MRIKYTRKKPIHASSPPHRNQGQLFVYAPPPLLTFSLSKVKLSEEIDVSKTTRSCSFTRSISADSSPMSTMTKTRRAFLRFLAAVPAALWGAARVGGVVCRGVGAAPTALSANAPGHAKVVIARNPSVLKNNGKPDGETIRRLLANSVTALSGKSDPRSAWNSFFSPSDIVGIKVNSLAGPGLSSHPELVAAIVEGLASAGISKQKIIVWDRMERELASAGFVSGNVAGARVMATDSAGVGYENEIEFSGEVGSCFSRILSRLCTAIINVPALKDHDLAGVSLGMKNFYGAIHNPNKYHDNNCDPYIADLCAHPFIAGKLRLVICDALIGQCHGGPAARAQWSWPPASLLVSTDPVAVDRVGWELIEQKRRESDLPSLKDAGREPTYIATADRKGLGVGRLGDISKMAIS